MTSVIPQAVIQKAQLLNQSARLAEAYMELVIAGDNYGTVA